MMPQRKTEKHTFFVIVFFLGVALLVACKPGIPPAETFAPTRTPLSPTDTLVPAASPSSKATQQSSQALSSQGEVYENSTFGFRFRMPADSTWEIIPTPNKISLSLGIWRSDDGRASEPQVSLVLNVYEKPAQLAFLDWFNQNQGDCHEYGELPPQDTFFFMPFVEGYPDVKGNPALVYEGGCWPIPYGIVIDRDPWVIGLYYLRDYPIDYSSDYESILASLEFFLPDASALPTPLPVSQTPVPTVCLDERAQPLELPHRQEPLEVRFISDGNIWLWEEKIGLAQQITETGDAQRFTFSPDGQVIVIERRVGNIYDADYSDDYKVELWAVNRDGSNLRQLVSVEQFDSFVQERHEAWSANVPEKYYWLPNTHHVIFGVYPLILAVGSGDPVAGYWSVDADTLELQPAEPFPRQEPDLLSPDGSQRAIIHETSLSLVNADGTNLRENVFTFLSIPCEEGGCRYYPQFEWALDSQSLLAITFTEDIYSEKATFTTWRIPIDGSPALELATFSGMPFPVYLSPTQEYLAYRQRTEPMSNNIALHLALLDGSQDVIYAQGNELSFWGWAPDGVHFVFAQLSTLTPRWGHVCAGPVPLLDRTETPAEWITWVDVSRFLFVKIVGERYARQGELWLKRLDGPSRLIGSFNGEFSQFEFNVENAVLRQE